jgi:PKD domain
MKGRKLRRVVVLTLATAAAALAVPAVAGAATFCVGPASCAGISKGDNLQSALSAAQTNPGADDVLVSDRGSPYVGPFSYNGALNSNEVSIRGNGPGRPVITAGIGATVLTVKAASLVGVDVRSESSASGTGVASTDASLRDVTVSANGTAPGGLGILAGPGTQLEVTRIVNHGVRNLLVGSGGGVVARDVRLENALMGVAVVPTASLELTQARVTSHGTGAFIQGTAGIDSSVITTTGPAGIGVAQDGGLLGLDHVTVARSGAGNGSDSALSLLATAANGSARLQAVALAGYSHGITRTLTGHTLDIFATDSVWDPSGDSLGGAAAGGFAELGNAHVAPPLVDLARGDFRPRGGSVLIDRDIHVERIAGLFADIDGHPAVDGDGNGSEIGDVGAFEYRRRAPQLDGLEAPTSGATGALLSFAGAASDPDGDPVQLKWEFGDGTIADGSQATHAYATPGAYQLKVTATDSVGLSASRQITITVGDTPSSGTSTGGTAGTASDSVAPVLSSVRLSTKSVRLTRARGLRLRFKVSEGATLRIVPTRLVGSRSVAVRGAIIRQVKPGPGSMKLARALRRLKLLRPGRLALAVRAVDPSGNRSARRIVKLTLRR